LESFKLASKDPSFKQGLKFLTRQVQKRERLTSGKKTRLMYQYLLIKDCHFWLKNCPLTVIRTDKFKLKCPIVHFYNPLRKHALSKELIFINMSKIYILFSVCILLCSVKFSGTKFRQDQNSHVRRLKLTLHPFISIHS